MSLSVVHSFAPPPPVTPNTVDHIDLPTDSITLTQRGDPPVIIALKTETEEGMQHNANGVDHDHEPNVDIILNNVVCSFSVRCHLNLRQIAMNGSNVEYHKSMAMLVMKLREPRCTASIWSSGKITMTGATTEDEARKGARRCARIIQKLGFNAKFTNYRVVNVLATCTMPFAIRIAEFASAYPRLASYEPELHPGCTFKMHETGATLKIFSTGSITITGKSVGIVQSAVESAYALVYEYRKERRPDDIQNFPLQERVKRRREARLLKETQRLSGDGKGNKRKQSLTKGRPAKKRCRRSHGDHDDEDDDEVSGEGEREEEEEEFRGVLEIKTEVDLDETEEEEDFDSEVSHD